MMLKLFTPGPVQLPSVLTCQPLGLHYRTEEFREILQSLRNQLHTLLCLNENFATVFFNATGTGSNECLISAIVPHYKTLFLSNGSFGDRLIDIAACHSNSYSVYRSSPYTSYNLQEVETTIREIKPEYVFFVHHETRSSLLNDINSLCRIIKKYNAKIIVDCMSSIVAEPINILANEIEFISYSSSKGLRSLTGLSCVTGKTKAFERLPDDKRSYYFNLKKEFQNQVIENRIRFGHSPQLYTALHTSLEGLIEEGLEQRRNSIKGHILLVRSWADEVGIKPLIPYDLSSSSTSTFISPIAYSKLNAFMRSRGFQVFYGESPQAKQFQISMLGDVSHSDVMELVTNLNNCLTSQHLAMSSS